MLKIKKNKPIKGKSAKISTERFTYKFIDSIRGRIIVSFSILMAIIICMQIISYINITNLQNSLRDFADENLEQQILINNLASDIAKLSSHDQTYLITGDEACRNRSQGRNSEKGTT